MMKDNLERIIVMGTSDQYSNGINEARKDYQKIAGKIYEDDKSYESQMALFLEWYVFDRVDIDTDRTIIETIINESRDSWPLHLLQIYEGFATNIYGLFGIKKIRSDSITVINLFDNEKYEAVESDGKLLFSKYDLFEGRLVPYENSYHFTGSFCFHPEKAGKFIKQQIEEVSVNQLAYKKDLKKMKSQLDDEIKSLNKTEIKIDKLKSKLEKSNSENKISKIKMEMAGFEAKKSDFEAKVSHMEKLINSFVHEKIIREGRAAHALLAQKLSYMHLIWERSRQIDLNDIYRN